MSSEADVLWSIVWIICVPMAIFMVLSVICGGPKDGSKTL